MREEFITTLMEGNEYGSSTFSMVIKKHRSSISTNIQLLPYHEEVNKGQKEVVTLAYWSERQLREQEPVGTSPGRFIPK